MAQADPSLLMDSIGLNERDAGQWQCRQVYTGAIPKPFERALLALADGGVQRPKLVASPTTEQLSWDLLPAAVHPTAAGLPESRVARKCSQISSMVHLSRQLLDWKGQASMTNGDDPSGNSVSTRRRIIDFGGGTGALALPLAASCPDCDVTIVDVSSRSLVSLASLPNNIC